MQRARWAVSQLEVKLQIRKQYTYVACCGALLLWCNVVFVLCLGCAQ